MMTRGQRTQELALPVAALSALHRALEDAVGSDSAARVLHAAGNAAGEAFYALLASSSADSAPTDWSEAMFWRRFGDLFARRGWGRLRNERPHEGVGELSAPDWAEADPEAGAQRPTCAFGAGLLANLLGRVSNEEVAVLEVECRSAGSEQCRFLYGSPAALDAVYARLRTGEAVGDTLAALR